MIDDILSELLVSEKRLRRRTPVRLKQIRKEVQEISKRIKVEINLSNYFLERGHFQERDLILVDKIPLAMQIQTDEGKLWYPTIRGILAWGAEKNWAAVDHGAIPFLMNGADCMGAGVHLADPEIEPGEIPGEIPRRTLYQLPSPPAPGTNPPVDPVRHFFQGIQIQRIDQHSHPILRSKGIPVEVGTSVISIQQVVGSTPAIPVLPPRVDRLDIVTTGEVDQHIGSPSIPLRKGIPETTRTRSLDPVSVAFDRLQSPQLRRRRQANRFKLEHRGLHRKPET